MPPQRLGVTAALVDGTFVRGDVVIDAGVIQAIGSMPAGRARRRRPWSGRRAGQRLRRRAILGVRARRLRHCDDGDGWLWSDVVPADDPDHGARHLLVRPGGGGRRDRRATARGAADRRSPGGSLPVAQTPRRAPYRSGYARRIARSRSAFCDAGPIALMTLAPELDGAGELIDLLRRRGVVVSAGHTDATAVEAHAAFDAGVTMVTHLWNAQRQITSREPGLAGVALDSPWGVRRDHRRSRAPLGGNVDVVDGCRRRSGGRGH